MNSGSRRRGPSRWWCSSQSAFSATWGGVSTLTAAAAFGTALIMPRFFYPAPEVTVGYKGRWHLSQLAPVMTLATLDRPRIDVTLRISGLFRDIFESQIALFDLAVRRVAALDEDDSDNPLAAAHIPHQSDEAGNAADAVIAGGEPFELDAGIEVFALHADHRLNLP